MSDTLIKQCICLKEEPLLGASFLIFDHSTNYAAMSNSSNFNTSEIASALSNLSGETLTLEGDSLTDTLRSYELSSSNFKIYTDQVITFPEIYRGSSQALDFCSPVHAESIHYLTENIQGDGPVAVAYPYNELDTFLIKDEISIYTHKLYTGGEALKIDANGTIIDEQLLEEAFNKIKGLEVIHLQGQNNTLNLKLEDLLQLTENGATVHILGESQNAVSLNLEGQGFKASFSSGFTTYTNGDFSIIVENTLNRGGIVL